jgi:putative RecB family exonuclease
MPLYSHSRLSSFENCPRQFAFRYIEKPEIDKKETIEAFLGSRVHETLEKLYQDVEMERTPKWDDVLEDYERRWDREWSDRVTIVRGEYTPEDYRNVGRRCLKEYFVRYFPFREGKIIGLEYRILVDLAEGREDGYKLQGYIDRLVDLGNGEYEIHDYKTSRNVPEQDKLDDDRQLALYQIGVQVKYPDARKVHLIWHYVRQDKEVRSYRTREQLEALRAETITLIDTILEQTKRNDFPPHETMLCDWCEFHDLCPAKRHLVITRGLSAEEFSADQGVALADKYIAAKERRDSADVELEQVRQMVLQFAEQQDVTTLRGHDRKLKITTTMRERLPSSQQDPDALARLETAVRASGKWDQVSKLADKKLREALQTDVFDPVTRNHIDSLLIRTPEPQVRVSRLSPRETDDD